MENIDPEKNLIDLVSKKRTAWRICGAILSAILLSFAYPPFCLNWIVWFAFLPILTIPIPATRWKRFGIGYVFGLVFWQINIYWLNTIGFAAGFLLSFCCAFLPAIWYLVTTELLNMKESDVLANVLRKKSILYKWGFIFVSASIWVLTEYIRSYLFTGFSWNQLAISQWNCPSILILASVGGVYLISFIIAFTNISLAIYIWPSANKGISKIERRLELLPVVCIIGLSLFASKPLLKQANEANNASGYIKVLAVQGNIPQCREGTEEQVIFARDVYSSLSLTALQEQKADIVVWPESAVPVPIYVNEVWSHLNLLFKLQDCMWLIGTIDVRPNPITEYDVFNSVWAIDSKTKRRTQVYDKIHIVPFGEFVPFEKYLPFLTKMIGMGRSLTPGTKYTIFDLPQNSKGGVNICYEDAYPEISREFTRNGANILFTLTNDAWYAESAGSFQHYVHAIFRSVENCRPLFRSGNNSDTCLIMPNGSTIQPLINPETKGRFYRGYEFYNIPVNHNLPTTFYTLYGDWIVLLSFILFAIYFSIHLFNNYRNKKQLLNTYKKNCFFKQD